MSATTLLNPPRLPTSSGSHPSKEGIHFFHDNKKIIPKYLLLTFLFLSVTFSSFSQLRSTLPIMVINTNGSTIVDEPKIMADMKIMHKGNGQENLQTDSPNVYDGKIGIEFRGSSSQQFPKKPFGFETWDAKGEDINVSLFGWPSEADWILFASFNEKSLMHNVLTMKMAREMGIYASRTQYVEVVLNGEYQGVYVLMEKIKRDNGRVDIARLDPNENSGDDLTGGYIIKIDKGTGTDNGSWVRDHQVANNKSQRIQYYYEYPSDPSPQQRAYIQKYVDDFENALKIEDFTDPNKGYRNFINTDSFVKLFLLNEVSRNIDGYRISTFMYKDKDSKGEEGKLHLGPPWDYDISYGNANYCQGNRFDLFAYRFNDICPDDFWQVPFWWNRLMQDPDFLAELRDTYLKERENGGVFSDANITKLIDGLQSELQQPQARNFQKWPILGQYVWPQPEPIARTWQAEVDELRTWLQKRLIWLDSNMPGVYVGVEEIPEVTVAAYPNPFIDVVSVSVEVATPQKVVLTMYDSFGREFINQTEQLTSGKNIINLKLPSQANLQQLQFLSVEIDGVKTVKKLVQGGK